MVRSGRELPQRFAACDRTLHAEGRRPPHVRSHDRRSQSIYAPLEDQPAALSPRGKSRTARRIPVRGVCGRTDVRAVHEAAWEIIRSDSAAGTLMARWGDTVMKTRKRASMAFGIVTAVLLAVFALS